MRAGAAPDRGLGAHPLAGRHGPAHHVVEAGVERARLASELVGVAELAEHLRLPHHHALEAAGDAEHVADRLGVAQLEEVVADLAVVDRVEVHRQPRAHLVGEGSVSGS